ncbi:MAG: CBS domain-containing protein [Acidobacteriota bacterium]
MRSSIETIMAQGVVIARPDHTVDYVRRQMKTLDIHAVPVADDDGQAIGIVRWRDLIDAAAADEVAAVMSKRVLTADLSVDCVEAARTMRANSRHHLVVTERGRIVGIVSAFDFLQLVAGHGARPSDTAEFATGIFQVRDDASRLDD